MRILFLNHNVVGAGTYQRAWNFGRELAGRGHEVTLVTTSRAARVRARWETREGLRVLEAPDLWWGPARSGWDPWNTWRRIVQLGGRSFDLVHAFDSRPVVIWPALAVRRATGAPLFMDWADWWGRGGTIQDRSGWLVRTAFGPIETWFEEAFRGHAVASTAISEALRRRCIGLGIDARRVLRVPDGCRPPANGTAARDADDADGSLPAAGRSPERGGRRARPPGADARRHARAELGLPEDAPLVVHLGTALPRDAAVLFDAMRAVSRAMPRTRLVMVGGYGGALPADQRAAGTAWRTGFVSRDALGQWLAAATVCVIPLRDTIANRGRWPGKISEYLAAGRATVMTRVGDAAAIVAEAGAGWVCDPDAAALAETLILALRDPNARHAAERQARRLACTRLAWPRLAEMLDRYYVTMLNGGGRAATGDAAAGVGPTTRTEDP